MYPGDCCVFDCHRIGVPALRGELVMWTVTRRREGLHEMLTIDAWTNWKGSRKRVLTVLVVLTL